MTSRERVLAALEHRQPDRVPIDVGAMRSTGLTAIAYARLLQYLGMPGDILVYDVIQQLAQPSDAFLDWVGADVVDLGRAFLTRPEDWTPWELPDGTPAKLPAYIHLEPRPGGGWYYRHADGTVLGEMPPGVYYLSQVHWPLIDVEEFDEAPLEEAMGKVTWAALPTAPWHLPRTPEGWAQIRAVALDFYARTDRAVMVGFGGNLLEWGQFLRRMDGFLTDLAGDPRRA
ncbi:MAG: methyltransferase, partial [Armatimonadota bacterium]|nr:methyltransferase [Armatimonadota bacterium]